ncbi:hypothetical protein M422DRAFT_35924 [Sphaerobolus stellatus SS14]|uniref:Uncharacterized protein n=1 Tax=Sphaerobolus stellatus (strain SS14) TaxID=990650 RepID=A0A0C9UC06_SPHS4|nr:hypothetical protein M422DRAFT_35924 [Sphaerobolus stellatus SS14]
MNHSPLAAVGVESAELPPISPLAAVLVSCHLASLDLNCRHLVLFLWGDFPSSPWLPSIASPGFRVVRSLVYGWPTLVAGIFLSFRYTT